MIRDRAEQEELVHGFEFLRGSGAQQPVIIDVAFKSLGQLLLLRPFHLDRRHRHEELAGKITGLTEAALADRLVGCERRELFRELRRGERAVEEKIDRAGDGGAQALGREALDPVDAGFAGCQRLPIGLLALAERGDDAEAGNGDDPAALGVTMGGSLARRSLVVGAHRLTLTLSQGAPRPRRANGRRR